MEDVAAVTEVVSGPWLTSGVKVAAFEKALADYCGVKHAVAVNSGTAALHCAYYAAGVGPGDEVLVPAVTFVATANATLFCGGTPFFADIDPDTLLVDPDFVEKRVTEKTKAIVAVDYAGQPCDYDELWKIANETGAVLIADACHSLGATYKGRKVGTLADMTVLSFHPSKAITTGEGGALLTDNDGYAESARRMRNHGRDGYDMRDLGWNYRMTDIAAALGLSQLSKLDSFIARRQEVAGIYDTNLWYANPLLTKEDRTNAYHLYVLRVCDRDNVVARLRRSGVEAMVHYAAVYQHPFYRATGLYRDGLCPNAERLAKDIVSIPIWAGIEPEDINSVCRAVGEALS
jgi:perosamine synthetase